MSAVPDRQAADLDDDARFMSAAIHLGTRELGRTWPNPAVGALVVKNGVIIGRGWTRIGGRPHAEPIALAEAGSEARGATLYVSLEPCSHYGRTPPCVDAIVEAGITRVVSALRDPNPQIGGRGYARLRAAGIEVREDVLRDEARYVHEGHLSRILNKRPHVTLKLALSADGKVGLEGRRPAPITGEAVRGLVHMMRARSDAIAVGIGTVLADDPLLTCRLPGMADRSPMRIVFDTGLQLSPTSQLALSAREVSLCIVAGNNAPREAEARLAPHGIEVIRVEDTDGTIDPATALRQLHARGITRLMLEGGPRLAAAFLNADLVDEAVIFESTKVLGPQAVDGLSGPHAEVLGAAGLIRRSARKIGEDMMFSYGRY